MQRRITRRSRSILAVSAGLVSLSLLAACSGAEAQPGGDDGAAAANGDGGVGAAGGAGDPYTGTIVWWDGWAHQEEDSDFAAVVTACGEETGINVVREIFTGGIGQIMLAAQAGDLPDLIAVDNPHVPMLAETGAFMTMDELGTDTTIFDSNIIGAAVIDGDTYAIPVGANTLALYYNADILAEAGVDPASITDWASLTTALEAVTATGNEGISIAGIGNEEGSFQFLPFFWGAGADLRQLDSPEAIAALDLWTGWINDGLTPNSTITNNQIIAWDEFLTGRFGFAVNGTWQVNSAANASFETGVIPIPGRNGGVAPAPTGGEMIMAPLQPEGPRLEATRAVLECMASPERAVDIGLAFAYYIPAFPEGQELIVERNPALAPWATAVQSARGRTGDGLGLDYALISEPMFNAIQAALTGVMSPADALANAQAEAAAATGN